MARSYRAVLRYFENSSSKIQKYFRYLPDLLKAFPGEVSIGYLGYTLERGFKEALYLLIVNKYKTHMPTTWTMVMNTKQRRHQIQRTLEGLIGLKFPHEINELDESMYLTRNKVMHGLVSYNYQEQLDTIEKIIKYAGLVNQFFQSNNISPMPFAKKQGKSARKHFLSVVKSKEILDGLKI